MSVPFRGYRHEWLVLALVALASLTIVNRMNTQDVSRISLTSGIVRHGTLNIDRTARYTIDRAQYGGHWYTDKAPGISFLAVPPLVASYAAGRVSGKRSTLSIWRREWQLWFIRLCVAGVFLAAVFAVGRVAEGLVRGTGAATAVTFGLGTLAGPLALTTFGHATAGALDLCAFLLAWHGAATARLRTVAVAALLVGFAVLVEYLSALVAVALLAYVLVRAGGRAAGALVLGALPAAAALAWYDTAAFGAPWRLSYSYVANVYAADQARGLFGISAPRAESAWLTFLDGRGLLVVCPAALLGAAALALWRLGRGRGPEAAFCTSVVLLYLFATLGYFLPYGGNSPGPRFLAAALPFACLGLPAAWRRWPVVTAVVALYSVALTTFDSLTWSISNALRLDVPPHTVWSLLGVPEAVGMWLVVAAAAGAVAAAGHALVSARTPAA